jgi:hypothetical protein
MVILRVFNAEGLPVDIVPAVAVDVVGRSATSMSTAHSENRKGFSIDYESQSWEFLLAAPPLLHAVAQMHRGDGFIDDTEFFSPQDDQLHFGRGIRFLDWAEEQQLLFGSSVVIVLMIKFHS